MAHNNVTDTADEALVWYFAYGSNMLAAKFTGGRGIRPRKAARVRTPGWTLALDVPGMPYQEPTFTSLLRTDTGTTTRRDFNSGNGAECFGVGPVAHPARPAALSEKPPARTDSPHGPFNVVGGKQGERRERGERGDVGSRDALGVAYLITATQYARVIASEGGGIAYADVALSAVPVGEADGEVTGGEITVRTLAGVMRRRPWPRPSGRYMKLLTDGAEEAGLPMGYQRYLQDIETYEKPHSRRGKVGAAIFVGFWGPVMGLMEKITHATTGANGYCPKIVIWLVRLTMVLIWLTHDLVFAPLFGRGDGHGESESRSYNAHVVDEEKPLLEP